MDIKELHWAFLRRFDVAYLDLGVYILRVLHVFSYWQVGQASGTSLHEMSGAQANLLQYEAPCAWILSHDTKLDTHFST